MIFPEEHPFKSTSVIKRVNKSNKTAFVKSTLKSQINYLKIFFKVDFIVGGINRYIPKELTGC